MFGWLKSKKQAGDAHAGAIREALERLRFPADEDSIVAAGRVSEIVVREGKAYFAIEVRGDEMESAEQIRQTATALAEGVSGVDQAFVTLTTPVQEAGQSSPVAAAGESRARAHAAPAGGSPFAGAVASGGRRAARQPRQQEAGHARVKKIIAVASGKGGVGKSTTSANLALALAAEGSRVGLLDMDVFGPSMPRLFGVTSKPEKGEGRLMKPIEAFGLPIMSMGFLVDENVPVIWRGAMVASAVRQLLQDVEWGELDILVIDMPPGTGDTQLSLAQNVSLAGAVIVSTPQDLALIDARRGLAMFNKVEVPVLGIVENMSYFLCPHCGGRADIFGHGGARDEAVKLGVPFLGDVPLHTEIRERSDSGRPVVASAPESEHAAAYRAIARNMLESLEAVSRPAPEIVL